MFYYKVYRLFIVINKDIIQKQNESYVGLSSNIYGLNIFL